MEIGCMHMDRFKFIRKALQAGLAFLFMGTSRAESSTDDSGFTMSSGSLLGAANGTQGA